MPATVCILEKPIAHSTVSVLCVCFWADKMTFLQPHVSVDALAHPQAQQPVRPPVQNNLNRRTGVTTQFVWLSCFYTAETGTCPESFVSCLGTSHVTYASLLSRSLMASLLHGLYGLTHSLPFKIISYWAMLTVRIVQGTKSTVAS